MIVTQHNYVGDGTDKELAVNFTLGFLSRDYVHAFIGAELTPTAITWINDGLITIGVVALDVAILIKRTTPVNILQHNFSDGAVLGETELDQSHLQLLMIIQEGLSGGLGGEYTYNKYVTNTIAGDTIEGDTVINNITGGSSNVVINSDFSVWQRGQDITVISSGATGKYTADMMVLKTAEPITANKSTTDLPNDDWQSAMVWLGSDTNTGVVVGQNILSEEVKHLQNESTLVLSAWIYVPHSTVVQSICRPSNHLKDWFQIIDTPTTKDFPVSAGWTYLSYEYTPDANLSEGIFVGFYFTEGCTVNSSIWKITGLEFTAGGGTASKDIAAVNIKRCQDYYRKVKFSSKRDATSGETYARELNFPYPMTTNPIHQTPAVSITAGTRSNITSVEVTNITVDGAVVEVVSPGGNCSIIEDVITFDTLVGVFT